LNIPQSARQTPIRLAIAVLLLPMLAVAELSADCASQQYAPGGACDPLVREAEYLADSDRLLSSLVTLGQIPGDTVAEDKLPIDYLRRRGDYALFFGMSESAERTYQRIAASGSPPRDLFHARLKLAEFDYQRGHAQDAEHTLAALHDSVPPDRMEDWQSLYARVLMAEGRYADAAGQLPGSAGTPPYTRYNRGIALINSGNIEAGRAALNDVGLLDARDDELMALRDKANLVLGYDFLRAGDGRSAVPVFERIRLDGPFSAHALLGLGWAQIAPQTTTGTTGASAESGGEQATALKRALVYWSELASRDAMDPAVQEAMLAIPYSLAQLGAQVQAEQYYGRAIDAFEQTGKRLGEAIDDVHSGRMIDTIAGGVSDTETGWTWDLHELPNTTGTYYLHGLIAENHFQEALKNYRDLRMLGRKLGSWSAQLQQLQKNFSAKAATVDIPALERHAQTLQPRIEAATTAARTQLETVAVEELQNQKKLNDNRIAEARLALAQLYDSAPRGIKP